MCNVPQYIFVFAVYLLVSYMCAKIRVRSCLVTDNFGLFAEIAVRKFLCGWRSYGSKPFLFCPLYDCMCLYIFLQLFVWHIVPYILLGIMRHRNVHYYYYYNG